MDQSVVTKDEYRTAPTISDLERGVRQCELQLTTLKIVTRLQAVSEQPDQVATFLAIAEAIDRVVPFDMLVSNTFFHNLHFLSSCFEIEKQEGRFRPLPERSTFRTRRAFDLHKQTDEMAPMSELFSQPGRYVGDAFADICGRYPNPSMARDTYGIQSVMYVPLTISSRGAGVIVVASRDPMAFTEADLQLLQTLFTLVATAIENLLVYEDLHQREREKTLQLALNNALVNLTDPAQLARTLAAELSRIVPFNAFLLRINQPGSEPVYHRTYLHRNDDGQFSDMQRYLLVQSQYRLYDLEHSPDNTPPPAGIYDGESHKQFVGQQPLYQFVSNLYSFQSLLLTHIPLGQGYQGCVALWSAEPSAFRPYHFDLLTNLIPQISLALTNLLSFETIRRRDQQKATQLAIVNSLLTQPNPALILPDIAQAISQLMACDTCLLLTDPTGPALPGWAAVRTDQAFLPLLSAAFSAQTGLAAADMRMPDFPTPDGAWYTGDTLETLRQTNRLVDALAGPFGMQSLLALPLTLRDGAVVTLVLGSRHGYAYGYSDLVTLRETGLQLVLALENRLAFDENERLKSQLKQENADLQQKLNDPVAFPEIVGSSAGLQQVLDQVRLVAVTDSTVLIEGETGTGKELIVQAIHAASTRKAAKLIKVNCAALPANLIESELFGHEKGAFTGATHRRTGKFELAHGGTLFLDEIGELPLDVQAKLLRAIQEGEIDRVGGEKPVPVDVRLIVATNKQLAVESRQGRFRADLYYRLNVFPIRVPPLRERRDDIPLLALFFARKLGRKMGKTITSLSSSALRQLILYEYPGNIRELEHIIERAVIVAQSDRLEIGPLPGTETVAQQVADGEPTTPKTLQEHERDYILQVLKLTNGRIRGIGGAAERLGVNANTLESRMQKSGIKKEFAAIG
jgi:formate hydrogenlyase transcriptional activator